MILFLLDEFHLDEVGAEDAQWALVGEAEGGVVGVDARVVGIDEEREAGEALAAAEGDGVTHQEVADAVGAIGGEDGHGVEIVFAGDRLLGLGMNGVARALGQQTEGEGAAAEIGGAVVRHEDTGHLAVDLGNTGAAPVIERARGVAQGGKGIQSTLALGIEDLTKLV